MNKKRIILLIASVALVLCVGIGATLAWIQTQTNQVENTFNPTEVTCEIKETKDGTTKSDVYIENTSADVDAYIRAAVVVNWVDSSGNVVATIPEGYSYNITYTTDANWVKAGQYYYYKNVVAKNGGKTADLAKTAVLIETATATIPSGGTLKLQIDIIADAIQAEPDDAVESAWPVTVENGVLTPNAG